LAVAAYDEAMGTLHFAAASEAETRRRLGVAWMNRGNALQKLGHPASPDPERQANLSSSIAAYDEAVTLFRTLPLDVAAHRNHLGAACLNRGHVLITTDDSPAAIASFERAIAHLAILPLDENPAYRLNLAGAWINLAHSKLRNSPSQARSDAQTALGLVGALAAVEMVFAEMSLRARRTAVTALGQLLVAAELADRPTTALATEASDMIDEGLALARDWESRGTPHLRPLAVRLFRLGAQLYRIHQPHFLAEFLLENLDPAFAGATFAHDPGFRAVADEALLLALADLQRPQLLVAGTPESERVVATARDLRAAQQRIFDFSRA
jgi:tetratricopeptide (TPR) repeat protein